MNLLDEQMTKIDFSQYGTSLWSLVLFGTDDEYLEPRSEKLLAVLAGDTTKVLREAKVLLESIGHPWYRGKTLGCMTKIIRRSPRRFAMLSEGSCMKMGLGWVADPLFNRSPSRDSFWVEHVELRRVSPENIKIKFSIQM